MAAERHTIAVIAAHMIEAARPLSESCRSLGAFKRMMGRLGFQPTALPPAFAQLANDVDAALASLAAVPAAPSLIDAFNLLLSAQKIFVSIGNLANAPAPPGVPAVAFKAEFQSGLFALLLNDYLASRHPASLRVLTMLGVSGEKLTAPSAGRPAFTKLDFSLGKLVSAVSDPSKLPATVFGWGTPAFRVGDVVDELAQFFLGLDFPVSIRRLQPAEASKLVAIPASDLAIVPEHFLLPFCHARIDGQMVQVALALHGLPASGGLLPGVMLELRIPAKFPAAFTIHPKAKMRLRAATNAAERIGFVLRPGHISVQNLLAPSAPPSSGAGIGFDFTTGPTVLFGDPESSRLEFAGASVDMEANFNNGVWFTSLVFDLKGFKFIFDPGEGDGFLRFLIGADKTEIGLPLALRWGQDGIHFGGSGSLAVQVHPHLAIGPASIDEIDFELTVPDDPKPRLRLAISAGISGGIGPVSFVLNGVGLLADAIFEAGNAGPLDLKFGFKTPKGVGVSIDGGGFRGGGELDYDRDKGEYSGTLELTFAEVISVRAVGILTTRLPDGSDTFSLLLIIVSEFVPIQLSYGFTLLGVGGLLGLNRTVDLDALQVGVRDGTLNSILFPTDVVANAPRIISDLKRVFPPREDRFLMGPMGKLGWGTPTLISVEIGLLLEIPRPAFVIIGVLRVQLPAEEFGTIYIQVNFSGSVDFEKGQLQFDASLYNSRILIDPITGDMALRIYWGGDPNFLLTVGGFHPAYTPPPMNIGELHRVGFVLVAGIPMVRAEVYLAITSNSVQFGAHVEILYGVSYFNVFGFVDLDVLIQFNPFMFIAEISAMVGVRTGTDVLFGIRISGTLKGPTPWNVRGEASFEIGFIIKVRLNANFEITAGEERNTLLPAIDVLGEIRKAIDNVGNWRAVLPNGANQHVSLREFPPGDALVLHPFGALEINQKVAPLNIALQRFGSTRPESGSVFKLAPVQINKAVVVTSPTAEQFAPAQFFELSDAEKLSRPAFARYESGLLVGADNAPQTDFCRARDAQYEVIYLPEHQPVRIFFKLFATLFNAFGLGNAAAQSPLSQHAQAPSAVAAEHVRLVEEQYAVVSTNDLTLHAEPLIFASATAAHQALETLVGAQPQLTGAIQVVPSTQIRRVA
jgi:uncharacterized protein DUF6603